MPRPPALLTAASPERPGAPARQQGLHPRSWTGVGWGRGLARPVLLEHTEQGESLCSNMCPGTAGTVGETPSLSDGSFLALSGWEAC